MPRHDGGKSIRIVVGSEGVQQFLIAALDGIGSAVEPPQVIENGMQRTAGHGTRLARERRWVDAPSYTYTGRAGIPASRFLGSGPRRGIIVY